MSQRTRRQPTLPSATAFLDEIAPARKAINDGLARVVVPGATYTALLSAAEALDKLAADLGHPGRFAARPPARG